MVDTRFLRRILLQSRPSSAAHGGAKLYISAFHNQILNFSANAEAVTEERKKGKWFTLPPFTSTIDGGVLGKELSGRRKEASGSATTTTTALKWILRCCPGLPRSLVQKLFRLRQVRRESPVLKGSDPIIQVQEQLKRVTAKDSMNPGDRIFLPKTVQDVSSPKETCNCSEQEIKFIRSLELYKDPAIIVINKPPGMPVQGGIGIKRSLDELAATCLTYDYSEPPRLVHRLDRDSSGILVLGRTQTSATVLHSIFREKTSEASRTGIDTKNRIMQRTYWALVIGSPRCRKGMISVPLGKVVVDDGKSDRITIIDNSQIKQSQHAITEYRVIDSCNGYTWLELSPLTGRKHQLRVHCAEVLGMPIVGDYKYGWQAHRKWKNVPPSNLNLDSIEKLPKGKTHPFDLDLLKGSIFEKHPRLHLHCRKMVLPNVSLALDNVKLSSDYDLSELESLELSAPLPSYMQRSWDILNLNK